MLFRSCDIKTVGLLPNALAKQAAKEKGAGEAWFVDELGFVTEGASSNAWIIDADGVLRTRDTNANILRGVTRRTLMDVIAAAGLKVEERAFTPEEARQAQAAADPLEAADYPYLEAERRARAAVGLTWTLRDTALFVLAEEAAWTAYGAAIKEVRRTAKELINVATNTAAVREIAGAVAWPGIPGA